MAGSLDPDPLDISSVSPGPWNKDTSINTEIENNDGHRVARVYKISDLDSSSLPWQENRQLIENAIGYATQAADRDASIQIHQVERQHEDDLGSIYRRALREIAAHHQAAGSVIRRLKRAGLL